jgi:hypothetical protein
MIVHYLCTADGLLREDRLASILRAVGKDHLVWTELSEKRQTAITTSWTGGRFTDLRVDEASLAKLAASCDKFLCMAWTSRATAWCIDPELVQRLVSSRPSPSLRRGVASWDDLNPWKTLVLGRWTSP